MTTDLVTITVTDADIKQGRINIKSGCDNLMRVECCPVALALRREWHPKAFVFNTISTTDLRKFHFTPKEVQLWIMRFDAGKPVAPITFQIPRHPQGIGSTPTFTQGRDAGDESEYAPGL